MLYSVLCSPFHLSYTQHFLLIIRTFGAYICLMFHCSILTRRTMYASILTMSRDHCSQRTPPSLQRAEIIVLNVCLHPYDEQRSLFSTYASILTTTRDHCSQHSPPSLRRAYIIVLTVPYDDDQISKE